MTKGQFTYAYARFPIYIQVSNIPGRLSDRWTKSRRFATSWDILRKLKPSRLLGVASRVVNFSKKDSSSTEDEKLGELLIDTYTRLEKGMDLTALIDYRCEAGDGA